MIAKVAVGLLALPLTCMALCTLRVEPVHSWMMRHDCLLAKLTEHPPSRPMPGGLSATTWPR